MSKLRLRQAAPALLVTACLLALTACGQTEYPNSTFNHNTDYNTSIDALWDRLLFWGTQKECRTSTVLSSKLAARPTGT